VNGLGDWVELELLCFSILGPFLKNNIVCSDTFSDSLHWKFRSQVEWFIGKEAKAFSAHATLLGVSISSILLVKIGNSPDLCWISTGISLPYPNWLGFFICSSRDGNYLLAVQVGEVSVLILEHLPPVGASAVVLQVVRFSGVMDIDGLVD
jgi:hypothetical protein